MASDEIIKIAEEYALKSGWSCIDEQLAGAEAFAIKQTYIDAYTQGRADALKELERVLQEKIRSNENTANSLDNSSDATGDLSYSIEASVLDGTNSYLKKLIAKIKLPGGEND